MENLNVLIVDDELGMRKGAMKVLRKFTIQAPDVDHGQIGFNVVEAADGNEAMEKLQNEPFDLVLLDYKMPGLSGLEVLGKILQNNIDVLTVMVTAYASIEVAVSATKNGAFDFLAKPFSPDELKSVVKKAARSLIAQRQAKKLADEKRKVRFQFISVLAHELKAPLAAIESYLQLMQRHTAGDAIENYDKIVDRSLVRVTGMRKLIFDLLDLTRIESGEKKRNMALVNVTEVARQSVETMQVNARERGITIELHAADNIQLHGDSSELEIIFNNLISNAVKYNKDDGRVDVSIRKEDNQVAVKVTDTGIGMTQEEQSRLFGEFVRIKNEQTRNILGSGLGLSILKRLSALYNGTVDVQSEKNVGSTFIIKLTDKNDNHS
ncbi:MAG: response regulator [Caldithrix sp.]|nr:response regulator [Caldithrix sp.]